MELLKTIRTYASLVRFPHTVFALPFAAIGYFYAVQERGFSGWLLLKVLLCMVLARNAAMGFNRYADRRIDALNPRTAAREIPRGAVTPKNALGFVIVNAALFIAVAAWINPLCLALSPVALGVILGYSLTKRFTSLSHLFLGLSLAIAPAGAYIAVTGTLTEAPVLLSALVLTWSSGFDIIYSLQDIAFDRQHGLNSLPARLGARGALWVSAILHLLTLALVLWVAPYWGDNGYARIGSLAFIGLLIYQHLIVRPTKLDRIGLAFGTVNGVASIVYAIGVILGFYATSF
ncbi:MAG: putative 4-hydroxybenzoate polyprenyltransferase [Rikenellaceae bacterium]|jgi:4-hydroxybenzoate polyprenyltransferase|nr:putative 4-hydroxybenzoate polyprenyltransferase [Rikenellaceae bacterium]